MISRLFNRQVTDNSIAPKLKMFHCCARRVADASEVSEKQASQIFKKSLANMIRKNLSANGMIESNIHYRSVVHHTKIELDLDHNSHIGNHSIKIGDKNILENILYARHHTTYVKPALLLLFIMGFITSMIGLIKDHSLKGEAQYAGGGMMGLVLLFNLYALVNLSCTSYTEVSHKTALTAAEIDKFCHHLAENEFKLLKLQASTNSLSTLDLSNIEKTLTACNPEKFNADNVKTIILRSLNLAPELEKQKECKIRIL